MNPADVKEEILQAAQAYLDTGEIPYLPYQGYQEYLESGNRVAFESHYFARRRMLVVLGLAYEMERKAAIKVLLEQVVWEICNEYTWCLPAHLPIVDSQFSSQARHTVDLFAAETGQSLAELFMLVGGDLSPVITERVLYEIDQRLFLPFEEQTWEWETKEIICTPDPKLGSAIVAKARGYDMKVITVDDQFVNAKGKPMESVPLVMMAASEIGARQGQELYKEMQKRGWDVKDTAVMAITADELDTARRRTTGSIDALKAAGFPDAQIYRVPTKSNDIPGAFDAGNSMLVQHPQVKHWLIVGMNDNTVLGGVRATEGQGFKAPDVIGIGINGVDAVNELSKAQPTGFYGSLLPSPDIHGYKTSEMLYNWVTKGVEPPKFTAVTDVVLITRDNFKEELAKKGL